MNCAHCKTRPADICTHCVAEAATADKKIIVRQTVDKIVARMRSNYPMNKRAIEWAYWIEDEFGEND